MTTYVEQYFLYGDVGMEGPLPGPLMALIEYADLTAGASIFFASLVLLSLAIGCWETLSPIVSAGANKFVLSPIRAVLVLLGWYTLELVHLCHRDRRHAALPAFKERFTRWIVDSRPYRLAATIIDWYFPFNRPLASLCRLSGTYAACLVAYMRLLVPVARYLSGIVHGWNAQLQSSYCPVAISRYLIEDHISQRHLAKAYYCLGEKAGLRLQGLLTLNDWHSSPRLFGDEGDINHFYSITFVAVTVMLAIITTWSSSILAKSDSFQQPKLFVLRRNPYPLGTPITQTEINLWDMINQYEGDLDKKKAQLAKKTALLTATTAELRASKKRQDEGWTQFERLASNRNEAVEAQGREQPIDCHLRQQLVETGGQLKVAEGKLRDERQKLANACHEVAEERSQLAHERQKLEVDSQQFADDQKVANDHQSLVNERQQLAGEHRKLIYEHQTLIYEHGKCIEQRQELANKEHHLANEHQQLAIRSNEFAYSVQAIQQERDEAKGQVMSMQFELDSTNLTANITLAEAQTSLSQIQQTEAMLRQSMVNLKSDCEQSLAQERLAAEQARRQASSLTEDVNDLQSRIGLAMRDAQRAREQAVSSQGTIEILKQRLAKYQAVERGSTQEIPKRPTGNMGSISTALAKEKVTVVNQLAEISDLKHRLEQAKQGAPRPSEQTIQENFQKLRAALEKERRDRAEDMIRWSTKTRDLETDNQKLCISLSNAQAQLGRRQSSRRLPLP